MIAFLLSIMTPYEWCRVIINFLQFVAMCVVPFIILKKKINLTYSEAKDEEEKDNK